MLGREDFVMCVRVLNALLHADASFSAEEKDYLSVTMDEMDFSDEERERVQEPIPEDAMQEAVAGLPAPVLGGLLQSLMKGAMIGGVDARERGFITRLARDAGADEQTILYLWERTAQEIEEGD